MRLFTVPNVLLVLVFMATHEGAHLDGLLSPAQAKWLNNGAKFMLSGEIDPAMMKDITKAARQQTVKAAQPTAVRQPAPNYQPFNFASNSSGNASAIPANFSVPVQTTHHAQDIDFEGVVDSLLTELQQG